ncbi:MAG: murein hydrolase activator EnvC family protein [Culicoidibacterales bacterium]
MKKQQILTVVVASVTFAWLSPAIHVSACASIEACQLQLETLQQQNSQVEAELAVSKGDLDAAKQRVEQTQNLIFGIDDEIKSYNQTITMLESEIATLIEEMNRLQADLVAKDQVLRERLVDLQMKNKVNPYLEFIIKSDSLNDFIARNEAIKLLNDYDKELMDEVAIQKIAVNDQKVAIELAQNQTKDLQQAANTRKSDQETLLTQLEVEKTNFQTTVAANTQKLEEINLAESVVDEQLGTLVVIQEQLKQEQLRKEAEANKPKPEVGLPGGIPEDSNPPGNSEQIPSQQGFAIPTARGYVSCQFMCSDYVNDKGHLGTDIAAPTGTATYAITDGYVILVKDEASSGGFGNMIAITHYVNGVEMVSVYGHLSSIGVSVGQQVSAGEYIGAVGNTGQSTGPHLHLEVLSGIGYMPALREQRAQYVVDSANYISYPASW